MFLFGNGAATLVEVFIWHIEEINALQEALGIEESLWLTLRDLYRLTCYNCSENTGAHAGFVVQLDSARRVVWEADKAAGVNVGTEYEQLVHVLCALHVAAVTTALVSCCLRKMTYQRIATEEKPTLLLVCFGNVKTASECLAMCMGRWIYKGFTTSQALCSALAQSGCKLPMLL